MRLEMLPILLGILAGIVGFALVADAAIPDGSLVPSDRRRLPRAPRSLSGEVALGLGILAIASALVGRDHWRYSIVAMLVALICCSLGIALNWRYVTAMVISRPAAGGEVDAGRASRRPDDDGRMHIR
ncbi:MAG: hypothetical protein WKG32_17005 [Gemmatimonadaceae bacterium]